MKNNRTFLEKLLDGAEVEWKTIAEISNKVSSGGTPTTSNNNYYENGNIPWLRTQEVDFKEIWNTDLKITEEGLNNSSAKWIPKNCVIVAMYGATVGKIAINKIPLTTNQACANIEVNPEIAHYRYVFHYLMSKYEYIKSLGSGSQTNINSQIVKKIRIPIPPLSVQTEIVKILDALTALTSELTSELILRRKQYEYYREKLLSEEELGKVGFEWRALKDILIRTKGTKITAAEMKVLHKENAPLKIFAGGKTFALVNYSDIPEKDINKNPSIIVKSRGFIEFEYYDKPFSHKNEMWSYYSNDKNINIKYIYYVLKNQEPYFQSLGSKMQMPQISTPDTDRYLVPIPPPYIQTEIVKILDKFESLTNSITEGLPLAIEQSQNRYEYYRELLLNFPGGE
ncbi:MAG: restriction endonuclease subunit S [Haemophilus parainfluenzae]|nr:restriction endonuclease subunit S [Haemophilus parainfluenzae]